MKCEIESCTDEALFDRPLDLKNEDGTYIEFPEHKGHKAHIVFALCLTHARAESYTVVSVTPLVIRATA